MHSGTDGASLFVGCLVSVDLVQLGCSLGALPRFEESCNYVNAVVGVIPYS
jgi:hypothetical protein